MNEQLFKAMKDQLEAFAESSLYYGNQDGDAVYHGNAVKESQAALKGECFICNEALGDDPNDSRFHITCAEREQTRLKVEWEKQSKLDLPF